MTRSSNIRLFALAGIAFLVASTPFATEIAPGRIFNPGGLQVFMATAYNPVADEYLIVSAGVSGGLKPQALLAHMTPDGTLPGGVTVISPDIFVQDVGVAYNPDRNEYFVVWRYDSPLDVWGTYLDGNGNEIGTEFPVASSGLTENDPAVAYSTASKRYIVTFQSKPPGGTTTIKYQMVDGDSTSGSPLVGGQIAVEVNAIDATVAYGSVSNKFLVVYTKPTGLAGPKDELFGKFVAGDGSGIVSGLLHVSTGPDNQNNSNIAYASSTDRWLVTLQDWRNAGFNSADGRGVLVNSDGTIANSFWIVQTPKAGNPVSNGWDVAGPIAYNAATDSFLTTWRLEPQGYAREVDPDDGTVGAPTFISDENFWSLAATARDVPSAPQFMILWRNAEGEDGVHAGILNLDPVEPPPPPPPPPTCTINTTSPLTVGFLGIPYQQSIDVDCSPPPLVFSAPQGLPPGLSLDPDTGVISGTPEALGDYEFTIVVTADGGSGASGQKNFALSIGVNGFDIARDLEFLDGFAGFYVLDGYGGVHAGGNAPALSPSTLYFGFDVAVDLELNSAQTGVYVLDAFGGMHVGGNATAMSPATPYFGFDIARAMELTPAGDGCRVIDGFGGVHIGGAATGIAPSTPYFGMDVAADIELLPNDTGFYVLDSSGGVHAGGSAPVVSPGTPYFGFDIARDLELHSGGGYYVLDGFAGVHASDASTPVPSPAAPYFDVEAARDLVVKPDASGLYILDGFGNIHTGGSAVVPNPKTPVFP